MGTELAAFSPWHGTFGETFYKLGVKTYSSGQPYIDYIAEYLAYEADLAAWLEDAGNLSVDHDFTTYVFIDGDSIHNFFGEFSGGTSGPEANDYYCPEPKGDAVWQDPQPENGGEPWHYCFYPQISASGEDEYGIWLKIGTTVGYPPETTFDKTYLLGPRPQPPDDPYNPAMHAYDFVGKILTSSGTVLWETEDEAEFNDASLEMMADWKIADNDLFWMRIAFDGETEDIDYILWNDSQITLADLCNIFNVQQPDQEIETMCFVPNIKLKKAF